MNLRRTSCALPDPLPWKPFNPFLRQNTSSVGLLGGFGSSPCLLAWDPSVLPPGVRWTPPSQASFAFFSLRALSQAAAPPTLTAQVRLIPPVAPPLLLSICWEDHSERASQRPYGTATVSIREPRGPSAHRDVSTRVGRGGKKHWPRRRRAPVEAGVSIALRIGRPIQ
uniref:Uncharacterized protein n=1 Tax=Myotis myotis TaxID=51298 RepID=A0A7J7Z4A2_MYOMY|nr:hypothetical protein mMyoMyo1_010508 [Myotis myotis]